MEQHNIKAEKIISILPPSPQKYKFGSETRKKMTHFSLKRRKEVGKEGEKTGGKEKRKERRKRKERKKGGKKAM